MSQRLSDYLTRETTDYLDQLDRLLYASGTPDAETLLRLAQGVRGSAEMAGIDTIVSVASRLEDAGRSIVSNNIVWSEEVRQLAVHTVRDLKILVRALNRWGPEEEARVRSAILRWEELEAPETVPVPITSLFYDDDGPHVLTPPRDASAEEVPVDELLLRGERALREALRLRPEIESAVGREALEELAPLLAELFDLVQLGLSGDLPAE